MSLRDEKVERLERYADIPCPTVIVVGDLDEPAVLTHAAELAKVIPGAEYRIVEGAGHMVSMEKANEMNELLAAVISS